MSAPGLDPRTAAHAALIGDVSWRAGHCAGCNHEYRVGERSAPGVLIEPEGIALYTLCNPCSFRIRRDRKFRRRVERDAYRALFGVGPDDVKGTA